MQYPKLSTMVLALALGAALPVGAQTVVQPAPDDSQTIIVSPPSAIVVEPAPPAAVVRVAPVPVPDPAADMQCRQLTANEYRDCVKSHKAQ